jgi:hypothetical protein
MLVLFLAAAKILAIKVGTSIDPASLPCWPACLALCQMKYQGLLLLKGIFFQTNMSLSIYFS